jgi:hypothetical protein
MQEIQFCGLSFPPLLVAVCFGLIMAQVLAKWLNRLSGDTPCCGAFATLGLTISLSSALFYLMYL